MKTPRERSPPGLWTVVPRGAVALWGLCAGVIASSPINQGQGMPKFARTLVMSAKFTVPS